jgi:hypothetical protein
MKKLLVLLVFSSLLFTGCTFWTSDNVYFDPQKNYVMTGDSDNEGTYVSLTDDEGEICSGYKVGDEFREYFEDSRKSGKMLKVSRSKNFFLGVIPCNYHVIGVGLMPKELQNKVNMR